MKSLSKKQFSEHMKRIAALLLVFVIIACSKDDDNNDELLPRIILGQLTSEYQDSCNHSSGFTGADYEVTMPYSGTENDALSRMLITVTPEGSQSSEAIIDFDDFQLSDSNGELTWNGCLLFLDAEWIDFEVRIETTNGELSSTSQIRLNRTDFDN